MQETAAADEGGYPLDGLRMRSGAEGARSMIVHGIFGLLKAAEWKEAYAWIWSGLSVTVPTPEFQIGHKHSDRAECLPKGDGSCRKKYRRTLS